MVKNPNWRRQTSLLFTKRVGFEFGAVNGNQTSKGLSWKVDSRQHLEQLLDTYQLFCPYLQVQVLLKECEEARGGVVSSETSFHPMSSAEVTSSSQVISEHLVTFR